MKVICAFDSFKGCLTSIEAGRAALRGIHEVHPDAEVKIVACADGGEGMAEAVRYSGIGRKITMKTVNSVGREVIANYTFDDESATAFIDMAAASGLTLLSPEERNPELTGTAGTGKMIAHALQSGAKRIVLGLGGSATNDAGLGALQMLGAKFYDKNGNLLIASIAGKHLCEIEKIDLTELKAALEGVHITLLCDVDNPFVGPRGATAVFAPQKGADAAMIVRLEEGLNNLAEVIKNSGLTDVRALSGAGAAGGMAGGFVALAGADIRPGADTLLNLIGFDGMLVDADLVLTGEGSSDEQTLSGKLPVAVMRRAGKADVACWLLSGKIQGEEDLLRAGFEKVRSINSPMKSDKTRLYAPGIDCMQSTVAAARLQATVAAIIE